MLHKPSATRGGGVGILYKPSLNIKSRHCKLDFNSFEIIETVLHIGSEKTLLIACLYRPGLLTKLQVILNDCVCFVYAKHRFCWRESVSVTKLAMELHILPVYFHIYIKFH